MDISWFGFVRGGEDGESPEGNEPYLYPYLLISCYVPLEDTLSSLIGLSVFDPVTLIETRLKSSISREQSMSTHAATETKPKNEATWLRDAAGQASPQTELEV